MRRHPLSDTALRLLDDQDGVVTRSQLSVAARDWELRSWLAQRALRVVHPGVYVAHNGPLTWHQHAWVGCLSTWPAALWGPSALRAADGPGRRCHDDAAPIHVAVQRDRHLDPPRGVIVHRVVRFGNDAIIWRAGPPRQRYEEASLDLALLRGPSTAGLAALAAGVQWRRTTAARLAATLAQRSRVSHRAFFSGVLDDLAQGACSVLEQAYVTRVERPHGLPRALRQGRELLAGRVVYRDNRFGRLVIELDGRLHHDTTTARDADMERDLDSAVNGDHTLRLSYGQVFDRSCSTAGRVGTLLRRHGWVGSPHGCGPGCSLGSPQSMTVVNRAVSVNPTRA